MVRADRLYPGVNDNIFDDDSETWVTGIAASEHQGSTILLVEQNANMALGIATRGYILETGKIVNAASSEKLREDPKVREAYLGEI